MICLKLYWQLGAKHRSQPEKQSTAFTTSSLTINRICFFAHIKMKYHQTTYQINRVSLIQPFQGRLSSAGCQKQQRFKCKVFKGHYTTNPKNALLFSGKPFKITLDLSGLITSKWEFLRPLVLSQQFHLMVDHGRSQFQTSMESPMPCWTKKLRINWTTLLLIRVFSYCWWKKSCTSWHVVYPTMYKILYIPGGAGFLPSTVVQNTSTSQFRIIILWEMGN